MKKLFMMAVFFLGGIIYANAQGVQDNFWIDLDDYIYNCNSEELVHITGAIHIVFKNNGTVHVNAKGTGMSYEGGIYNFNHTENYMPTSNQGTWTFKVNLIGKGKIPDFKAKLTAHYTINANGDLVVDFFEIKDNCDE